MSDFVFPCRPVNLFFVGVCLFAGGFLVKPKVVKPQPRGRGRPRKDSVDKLTAKSKATYQIEVIIVGEGINHHGIVQSDTLTKDYKYGECTYHIAPKTLYLAGRNFFQKLGDKIARTKKHFCVVFEENKPEAKGPEREDPEVITSQLLGIVEQSTVLKRAFSELFSKHIDGKKIFFILIVVIVGAFVYLYFSGYLDLEMLGF